jgi:uncharacterized protein
VALEPVDHPGGPLITGFAGRLIKIDGNPRPGGVILTPETALDWDGEDIEAMDTRAAARAWSLLRGEGRWISAALRSL